MTLKPRPTFRMGIRGRLFWAFGAAAVATLVATVVAWVSFSRFGDTLDLIVGRNIPAVTLAAQLAERGGGIVGMAPALSSAQDDGERQRIWAELSDRLDGMDRVLKRMSHGSDEQGNLTLFHDAVLALSVNLRHLDELVSQRLDRTLRKEELIERLRWASADFLDEIEPMLDDTRFNISLMLNRAGSESKILDLEMARQRALFAINADGSLLAELIGRAANIPRQDALSSTELYFQEVQSRIDANLEMVSAVPGALSLRQSIKDIQAFANGPQGLFALQRSELDDLTAERELLIKNQELLAPLNVLITDRVDVETLAALQSAERSQITIQQGRLWLVLAVFVSFVVVAPFVWVYVGRGLVGRITQLDDSMRTIADGDLSAHVPVGGEDEIAKMADALRTFRDTLSETQAELIQAAKLAALGQLTAGISHEINQPLAAIRHLARNAGVLIEKGRLDDARENIKKIDALLEKTSRITASLRDLARKPKHDIRPTDLVAVLDDVWTLLERRVQENTIEVEAQIDPACRHVMAGKVRLEQVVLNVISNAIDAMQDSPVRRLIVSAHQDGEWVQLRIRDTGAGMDADHLSKVFDPFFTTKDVGEGLGLGLSVSYNIIKDFGGTLRAQSKTDDGSTFWVKLKTAQHEILERVEGHDG